MKRIIKITFYVLAISLLMLNIKVFNKNFDTLGLTTLTSAFAGDGDETTTEKGYWASTANTNITAAGVHQVEVICTASGTDCSKIGEKKWATVVD